MLQCFDGLSPVSHLSLDAFSKKKAKQFAPFLNVLREASEYAADLFSSPWDFGLCLEHARAMGLNDNDLRWMVKKGWIVCQNESGKGATASSSSGFDPETRFVIVSAAVHVSNTDVGCAGANEAWAGEVAVPFWDGSRRELLFGGQLVKRFRWPAPNQETVISVFSEEDWPARIEDPLSQGAGLDPKRRLGDTIKCLNRNQHQNLIRFRGDGTGEGVFWERLAPADSSS